MKLLERVNGKRLSIPRESVTVEEQKKKQGQDLLIYCSRMARSSGVSAEAENLVDLDLNWGYVVEQARAHRIMILLYGILKGVTPGKVPAEILSLLHDEAVSATKGNLLLTAELIKILRLFDAAGIAAVPYKGPVLAVQAYGGIVCRQFGDLDILIPKKDYPAAKAILVAQGYATLHKHILDEEQRYLQTSHDYPFIHRETGHVVELQWGVTSRSLIFSFDYKRATEYLAEVTLLGRAVPSIAVEPLLFILCLHGAKHSWERLIWICDIAELIRTHPQLDWQWLIDYANHMGGRRILLLGLFLAQTILDSELPGWVLQAAQADTKVPMLARHVRDWLFHAPADTSGIMGNRRLFYMSLMDRTQERFQLALYYVRRTRHPLSALRRFGTTSLRRLLDW